MTTQMLFRAGAAIAAASLFLLGYAVANLSAGIVEVPGHWWSAMPVMGVVFGIGLGLYARNRGQSG